MNRIYPKPPKEEKQLANSTRVVAISYDGSISILVQISPNKNVWVVLNDDVDTGYNRLIDDRFKYLEDAVEYITMENKYFRAKEVYTDVSDEELVLILDRRGEISG